MYAGIRHYRMAPELSAVVSRQIEQGLAPLLRELPGFVAYYVVDAGDGLLLTVRVFEDRAGVERFDEIAMGWAQRNMEGFFSGIAEDAPHLLSNIPDLLVKLEADFVGAAKGGEKEPSRDDGGALTSGPTNDGGDQRLLAVGEVCEALGMGKSWVYKRIRSGEIPSVKLGGSVKVMSADLQEFLSKHRRHKPEDEE